MRRSTWELLNYVDLESIRWRHKDPASTPRWRDVQTLLQIQDRVAALHAEFKVYDECDCDDDAKGLQDGRHTYVDEIGLTCALTYVACKECCTHNGYVTEHCAEAHTFHSPDPWNRCSTTKALLGLKPNV